MSPDADLVFLSSPSRTRGEGPVDVTPEKGTEPTINFYPSTNGKIEIGRVDTDPRTVRVRSPSAQSDASNEVLGELHAENNAARLRLWEQDSSGARSRGISVDTDSDPPGIEVARDGNTTVRIERISTGGRIQLFDTTRSEPAFVATTTSGGGGELRLTDDQDRTTCHVVGSEGALLLSGTPETLDDQTKSAYGGGEVVLAKWQQSGPRDVHVHATGEGVSDYGVDAGNRPRILLDGPEATLELGRHRLGSERPAVTGRIRLRDDQGETLLEMRARGGAEDSEASLFWSDGTSRELRGRIRATQQGLVVYDAGGRKALVIRPDGEVSTRRSVSRL